MRKVFLENLPRREGYKGNPISWKDSAGFSVKFIYDDTEGVIKIISYDKKSRRLTVLYNDKVFGIGSTNLADCKISIILGVYQINFVYDIGDKILSEKIDLTITDRKRTGFVDGKCSLKVYKYKCNKCGFDSGEHYKNGILFNEVWKQEHSIKSGTGCLCCCQNSQITVPGINDIPTTAPWMVKYFQGGYDEAKKYTKASGKKIKFMCPNCNNIKEKKITDLYSDKSLGCTCGDGYSYPEKFMHSILKQLGVEFETQYSPYYLENRRSDFYLPKYNLIIETDGKLGHIGGKTHGRSDKTLEECIEIDNWKDKQHKLHGVDTIRINCFESDMEYIKNNILESKLNELFDFNIVDWNKCEEFALSNLVREVCDYWNNKEEWETVSTIFNNGIFGKISKSCIRNYLKKGTKLVWCNYKPKEEIDKNKDNFKKRRTVKERKEPNE